MTYYSDEEVDKIYSADADSFSFVDVAGSFIQNMEFADGLKKFQSGRDGAHEAFLYKVLSSASGDIGQTVYDNVKRYVSYIADVDVCKVSSLKSMLKLFGFNYTIFDKFASIPQEIVQLIDILSINKKFLVKDGWLKPEFIDLLSSYGAFHGDQLLDSKLNLQREFTRSTIILSACQCLSSTASINKAKLLGAYVQQDDTSFLSSTALSSSSDLLAFQNSYNYTLALGDAGGEASCLVYDAALKPLLEFPDGDLAQLTTNGASTTIDISNLVGDQEFIDLNQSQKMKAQLTSVFTEDVHQFDDGHYYDFIESIFEKVIYGYISLPYNVVFAKDTREMQVPIYPDLGDEYYKSPASLRDYKTFEDDEMLSVKAFYHISRAFDQSGIVDKIEAGDDSIDNYSGAELSILQYEMQRRQAPMDLSGLHLAAASGASSAASFPETRASFYRKRKVLEYASFVDGYFASLGAQDPAVYDVDPNYYVISNDLDQLSTVIKTPFTRDPERDINTSMISEVAKNLANLTLYIQKIREKIKQQTQKNYMKGTNLLLVYIINEYLIDYAKHNKDHLLESGLSAVYGSLSSHQFKESEDTENYTINSVEFYDETEYTNISASTSRVGSHSQAVNPRYWETTQIESRGLLKDDGKYFKAEDIEKFYLSTLNLNTALSGNLPNFLSTVFDLGADPTFMYNLNGNSALSIFSGVLSTGQFAHQIYEELLSLSSSWSAYQSWLKDGYEYPPAVASAQLSDSLENSIYVDLSSKYLSAVSAVYDANIQNLRSLSSSTDALLDNYTSFITSDYSYYYKKFESKYCYEDFDVDTGAYRHNWYYKNPDYDEDDMNLYEHLYQLDKYSNSSNIVNWALSDIIDYVQGGFDSIYDALRRDVTSKIGSYGFVDINALTLDDELTYTYNFLSDLIETRKKFLKDQLASLQQQATNVKTQYETVNNTFTNAVASFNDNNDGYKLGDLRIYAVSVSEHGPNWTGAKCQRNSSKSGRGYNFSVFVNGYWYWDNEQGTGSWGCQAQSISPVYKSTDTLKQRCAAVLAYMSTPTHFTISSGGTVLQYFYGLQNEGIKAVADNTSAALADIEQAYDNIVGMASAMFGISIDSPSPDIYQNILALVEKLVAVDETFFDNDTNISEYKDYLKRVISLSADYLPVKEAFDSIFKSSELGGYMVNFIPVSQLTKENLDSLGRYLKKTDAANLASIRDKISSLYSAFDQLLERKSQIEQDVYDAGVSSISFTTGNALEEYIYQIHRVLLEDVDRKTIAGNIQINYYKEQIQTYVDVVSDEVSSDLDSIAGIEAVVSSRLGELNFFQHSNYNQYKELFLTYGGKDLCYDPYYNIKNQVHPSYQLHPYLWNFVRKIGTDSLVHSGYQTKAVTELEEDLVNSYISKYINQYGMAIDTWINANKGLADYTGYLSRYEMSENYAPATGMRNEVVDYDGAFYPPALAEFRAFSDVCTRSVAAEMVKSDCIARAVKAVPDVSVGLVIDPSTKTVVQQTYTTIPDFISPLTSYTASTASAIAQALDSKLIGQQASAITLSTIVDALESAVQKTFFEKYYRHLGLVPAECQRVARQLAEYKDKIFEVTSTASIYDVHDIYKYGLDLNGNSYILYKKYDYSQVEELRDLSFTSKRNTPGEMWIRLAGHPIAFPAFTGQNPMYYTRDPRRINMSVLSAAVADDANAIVWEDEDHTLISAISSDMRVFFDFEFSKSKTSIAYVTLNGDYPSLSAYRRFDVAWVIGSQVQSYYDQHADIEWLQLLNNNGAGVERIDFNYNSSLENYYIGPDAISSSAESYPALIGCYPVDDSNIDFVYLEKKYTLSGDAAGEYQLSSSFPQIPQLFAVKIRDGITYTKSSNTVLDLTQCGQQLIGDTACVGYDSALEQTVIAVTSRTSGSSPDMIKTCTTSSEVDFDQNSDGPVITDPIALEMNSHDYFAQNVTIAKFRRRTTSLNLKSTSVHNINADISYIPSYPSLSNEMAIYAKEQWKDADYYCIELLGMSKDIDSFIKLVNPSPNPYLDYDRIVDETAFGRVYEDYDQSEDKTFKSISNPSLNPNSPTTFGEWAVVSYQPDEGCIQYSINLAKIQAYTKSDYEHMKILVYNKNTLGKEPYLMADLKTLDGNEVELSYSVDDGELGEVSIATPTTETSEYYAVGTHESFDLKTRSDSNRFANISKITCKFDSTTDSKRLVFKFQIQDKNFPFFVPSDAFRVLLHNPYDLTMFKYYHLLDAYGVARCDILASRPELIGQPDDGRGWAIYVDSSKVDPEKFKDKQASYVVDDAGLTTLLKDIELSNYSYLSDIYALSGYKGLGFKYDEELRFDISSDLYYYPTMNLSYPKQAADYLSRNGLVGGSTSGQLSVLKSIYNRSNLFVLDVDDPVEIADKIGTVAVPVLLNEVDDIRAYEDWLDTETIVSTYIDGGVEKHISVDIPHYQMYDANDPRALEWAHFAGEVSSQLSSPLEVPDGWWKNQTVDSFLLSASSISGLEATTSEELTSSINTDHVFVDINSSTVDLSRLLKIFVNYKKADGNAIDLYFNYFNWFDTPYIKMADGLPYLDTISGTYLKLKSGEDGDLDIIIQVKYYNGTQLCGYKNIKVLSYHIWNVSDDKPKFIIQKTYELQKDSQGVDMSRPAVMLKLDSVEVEVNGNSDQPDSLQVPMTFSFNSNVPLSSEAEFYLSYPDEVLSVDDGVCRDVEVLPAEDGTLGLKKIHIYSTDLKTHRLDFRTKISKTELATKYHNVGLYVSIDGPVFLTRDGRLCTVDFNDCTVTFKNSSLVAPSTEKSSTGTVLSAYIADHGENPRG